MYQISIITIIILIKYSISIYLIKRCNYYTLVVLKIYEINYILDINYSISSTQSNLVLENIENYFSDYPKICWINKTSLTSNYKFENINFQNKTMDILLIKENLYEKDIQMDFERIDMEDGKLIINFYFNNDLKENTYYFFQKETNSSNCGKNYTFPFHINNSIYKNEIIGFLECNNQILELNFNISICPKFCLGKCITNDKYCKTNEDIEIIIQYIKHIIYSNGLYDNMKIEDNTNNIYNIIHIDKNNIPPSYISYLNEFCIKVLNFKYNTENFYLLFDNQNYPEKSILLRDIKEKANYQKYCQNYNINTESIQIIDKKYELNFSHFLIPDNENDLLFNKLTFDSLKGKIEYNNETIYIQSEDYQLINKMYFFRKGIYYTLTINFDIFYKDLISTPHYIQNKILNIYPFYCNKDVNIDNRECKTNYSLIEIKKELEKININLHEHVNEKIINDDYYTIEIFDSNEMNAQNSFNYPLEKCLTIYKKIDHTFNGLIFIKYNENDKDSYFELYKNDLYNHMKLSNNYCINHIISNQDYKIVNTSILKINLNDLIIPKLNDDNIYVQFQLNLTSNSENYIGKLFEEKINNEINELEINLNSIITNSRKFFYYPVNKYYEISFSFEIVYFNDIKNNMIGNIKIEIFPEFCEPNFSSLEEKKCITNYEEDYIKNYILSDYNNETIYISYKILGSSYSLDIYEENNYNINECDLIFKKFYNFNDNDKYYVIKSERNSNENLIEWFNQKIHPYEKINEKLCTDGYFFKIEETINYNFKCNITDLIKSILPKNYLNNFEIKIYTEEEYSLINTRRLEIKSEKLNIEYIPYKYKYYNKKYYFEIEKDGIFLNIKGELNFIVYPIYCKNYVISNNFYNCFSNNSLEEIINFINIDDIKNIKEHSNEIIYNENYYFQIQKININEKIISDKINLDNCINTIREHYSLKQNENIYLQIIENKKLNQISFKMFNSNGLEYNTSFCSSIILKNSVFNYPIYQKLKSLNINLFDFNSSFYNKLCFDFSLDGNDLTFTDRKNLMIEQNLCYKNCNFKYFNKENNLINCECKINSNNQIFDMNIEFIKKENNKNDIVNYKFIKCSNLVFDSKKIKKNIGFWFFFIIIIIQISIIFYYLIYGQNYFNLLIETLDDDLSQNIIVYNKHQNTIKRQKENDITLTSSRVKIEKKKKQVFKTKNEIKKDNSNLHISNIDYLIYSNALKNDSRSFLLMYFNLIGEKVLLIKCFIVNSLFELKSINLFIFLLYISFIFTLNVLFYDENIISEKYQKDKISLKSNIKKITYSSLFTFIITKIIIKLSDYKTILNYIIYEFYGSKYFNEIMKKKIVCSKIKLKLFLFITLLINFWLLYFVSAFCSLYQNTQLSLFIGGIINLLILMFISLFFCFLNSSMRFISIYYKIEWLYNFSIFFRKII